MIQTVNFYDSLQITPDREVRFKSNKSVWSGEQSLLAKAVKLLQATTGCTQGATIKIKKSLPLISGLGGDSSDAAAVLRGLNQLWELGLSTSKLQALAQELGSDVSFFLSRRHGFNGRPR